MTPSKRKLNAAFDFNLWDSKFPLHNCMFFFDFDNTITTFDVLDDIIERFSVNDRWKKLERDWVAEKIGSKECLEGQLKSIRITKKVLSEYLSRIKVDGYFKRLVYFLKQKGINPIIVSDNFSFIVNSILRNNGISGIKVYSNALKFKKDSIVPLFPHINRLCPKSGNCKRQHIFNNGYRKKRIIYIGDGLSDVCAALAADVVFAKDKLFDYLKHKNKPCIAFRDLKDIYGILKDGKYGTRL